MNINFFIRLADALTENKKWLCISCFLLALFVRLAIIFITPQNNNRFPDLSIYADGGQLIANGINPYNFSEDTLKRSTLRNDIFAYNSFTCENQSTWNYYSSGNLPLTLLFFGAVELAFPYNIQAYRVAFAIGDSLLSLIICLLILNYWKTTNNLLKLLAITFLGMFSPILLFEGTFIPEDKGIQILLMLSAVYFSIQSKTKINYLLALFFLGASIAYKGLGLFLIPICYLMLQTKELKTFSELFEKSNIISVLKFIIVLMLFTVPYFIFYYPEVFAMAQKRLSNETSITPQHSSIWCVYYYFFGMSKLSLLRATGLSFFLILLGYGLLRRRYGVVIVSLTLLLIFVNYLLYNGAMNRMNITIVATLVVLGMYYKVDNLLFIYIAGSFISILCIGLIDILNLLPSWDIVFGAFNIVYLLSIVYFLLKVLNSVKTKSLLY
jgi:hypothetical protein